VDRPRTTPTPATHDHLDRKNHDRRLRPLRDAQELTRCKLYWIPVDGFPMPVRQRDWLSSFIDKLVDLTKKEFDLRPEVFLQARALDGELMDAFVRTSDSFVPIIGLGQRPSEPLPSVPTPKDIEDLQQGRTHFDFHHYAPDYCYWFLDKAEKAQRELFFGRGGLTMIFLKPDAQARPPSFPMPTRFFEHPMFQKFGFDIERSRARSYSLLDGFLEKSKALCGEDVRNDPQFKGLAFVLPTPETRHFFEEREEDVAKWFQLFDLYVAESPADSGLIIATRLDWDRQLVALLDEMRQDGMTYTEVGR
jgi:hypothetical protein